MRGGGTWYDSLPSIPNMGFFKKNDKLDVSTTKNKESGKQQLTNTVSQLKRILESLKNIQVDNRDGFAAQQAIVSDYTTKLQNATIELAKIKNDDEEIKVEIDAISNYLNSAIGVVDAKNPLSTQSSTQPSTQSSTQPSYPPPTTPYQQLASTNNIVNVGGKRSRKSKKSRKRKSRSRKM